MMSARLLPWRVSFFGIGDPHNLKVKRINNVFTLYHIVALGEKGASYFS